MPPPRASAKARPRSKAAPGAGPSVEYMTLEDGTQIPMKAPPGMDPAQAKAMMELLKANPEAAKNAWAQAQAVLQTPGMAQAMLSTMFAPPPPAATQEQFKVLQEDPELQDVMKDISANGISALQKYWDDTDLMMKISQKMGGLSLAGGSGAAAVPGVKEAPASASAAAGDDDADVPKAQKPTGHDNKLQASLFDAAKSGDAAAVKQYVLAGADVNGRNERGIAALGIAVGYNKLRAVEELLALGADVMLRDGRGNTPLHYAAGYGRQEIAGVLVKAGAQIDAANASGQKPADVAKMNGEKRMAMYLTQALRDQKHEAADGAAAAPQPPATPAPA